MLVEEYQGLTRTHGHEDGEYEFRRFVSGLRKSDKNPKGLIDTRNGFSLKGLMEACMATRGDPFGENWHQTFPRGMHRYHRGMFESLDAMGASTFSNIAGQLLIDHVRENFELASIEVDALVEKRPNPAQNLGTHKDPWLSRVFEEPPIIGPGQPYPQAHFIEQYITMPAPEKRGETLAIEMEMVYADKTRQAFNRANGIGEKTGLNRAKRFLATITGYNFTMGSNAYNAQQFQYGGTSYNVYATSGLWVNLQSGLTVTTYNDITAVETLFGHMTDLATGDPVDVNIKNRKVLCTFDKYWDLRAAFTATDHLRGSFPTSGDNIQAHFTNPLGMTYEIIPSKLLYNMLTTMAPAGSNMNAANAKQHCWWGDFQAAFAAREVYPLTIIQAPPNNPAEFYQDIAIQTKVSIYDVPVAQGPQNVVHTYAS